MIPPRQDLFARCGERDIKLTDRKKFDRSGGHRSLYLGLLNNILIGIFLAIFVFFLVLVPSTYVIKKYYLAYDLQAKRHAEYVESLQSYVMAESVKLENSDEIAEWVRENPYVYLLVYQGSENQEFTDKTNVVPGAKDKFSELSGSRIDDSMARDELLADARAGGYHLISLTDGQVIVALSEYSENLYLSIFRAASFASAGITFILMLVRYIGMLINRIKRFASDVTIVSELDMNYKIVSEGKDELAGLSDNVENMRQTMLRHIENEKEARAANTELITSISHDIRTPLTVLMGYIEMMREREKDEVMLGYIDATESTALRLKQLSDDMFKYLLAFGDTDKAVSLEEYDARMLFDQALSEHILLLREMGYDISVNNLGDALPERSLVRTDAQNLMRIVDNIFSNIRKYADMESTINIDTRIDGARLTVEVRNRLRRDTDGAESNGIGLKTCVRLGSVVADGFEYEKNEDSFVCRLYMKIYTPTE